MFSFSSKLALAIPLIALVTVAHAAGFWSDSKNCGNADLQGVTTTRYEAIHKQGVHGVVKYTGDEPIREVKVCGGGHVRSSSRAWLCRKAKTRNSC